MPREKPPRIVASESPNPAAEWDKQKTEQYGLEEDPEGKKIYKVKKEGYIDDPMLWELIDLIEKFPPEEAKIQLDAFVKVYPEKAAAYKDILLDMQNDVLEAIRDSANEQRAKRADIVSRLHASVPEQTRNGKEAEVTDEVRDESPAEVSPTHNIEESIPSQEITPITDKKDSEEVTPLKNEREVPHEETPEEKETREKLEAIRERNRVRNEAARKKRAEERVRRKTTEGDKKEADPNEKPESQESKEKTDTESQEGRDLIPRPKPEKKNEEPEVTRLKNEREIPRNDGREERPKNGWQQFAGKYGKKAAGGAAAVGITAAGMGAGGWIGGLLGSELGFNSVYGGLAISTGLVPWLGALAGGAFIDMAVWQFLKTLKEDWRPLLQSFMPFSAMKLPGGGGGGAKKSSGGGAPAGGGGHH